MKNRTTCTACSWDILFSLALFEGTEGATLLRRRSRMLAWRLLLLLVSCSQLRIVLNPRQLTPAKGSQLEDMERFFCLAGTHIEHAISLVTLLSPLLCRIFSLMILKVILHAIVVYHIQQIQLMGRNLPMELRLSREEVAKSELCLLPRKLCVDTWLSCQGDERLLTNPSHASVSRQSCYIVHTIKGKLIK